MRLTLTVSAFALAAAAVSPAAAQSAAGQKPAADTTQYFCSPSTDKKAAAALAAYNAAVAGTDAAATASARAAAVAAGKSDADRCVLGQIDLGVSMKAGDDAATAAKAEALANNPAANKSMVPSMLVDAGKMYFNAKNYPAAAKMFERATTLAPNDSEPYLLLARARVLAGQKADAPALAMKAIALDKAAGRKVSDDSYRYALQLALDTKNPMSGDLAREWLTAYPSPENWSTALQILEQSERYSDADMIDIYRLKAATGAFADGNDVGNYAYITNKFGFPGETVAAIKAGIAAGKVKAGNAEYAGMLKTAQGKIAADKASLAAATAKAISSGNAKSALAYGDANYGYGEYAKAADAYRAVLGMNAADIPAADLRLGMALAMSGDKAGAQAALRKVTGPRAAIAQYWLAYVNTKA